MTQIAEDLGPNLSLLCRKMDGLDRDQKSKRKKEEGVVIVWMDRMEGIEALRACPQLGKTSALHHQGAGPKPCYVCECAELGGCGR